MKFGVYFFTLPFFNTFYLHLAKESDAAVLYSFQLSNFLVRILCTNRADPKASVFMLIPPSMSNA